MPFERPSLSALRTQAAQDIASALPGSDPLLRFSNLQILGAVLAGMSHLHYGYLDWIAQQATPFTATEEFLEAWGALKGVTRNGATSASGSATFTGANGTVIPAGTVLTRGDGKSYTTTADGTVSGGSVTVPATAVGDPAGLTGAWGNCDAGTMLTIGPAIAGITSTGAASTAFTGGADLERDDPSFRSRIVGAYRAPPHGGAAEDYITWARDVSGVTRAWCVPNGYGPGTVIVYAMLDDAQAAHGGFPQGNNGVAAAESRDTAATGDQLAIANAILPLQPVTALVYVVAPLPHTIDFQISGIPGASASVKASILSAIDTVLRDYGQVNGGDSTLALSYIEAAIAAISGTAGFVIDLPAGNITSTSGYLPVRGNVVYV